MRSSCIHGYIQTNKQKMTIVHSSFFYPLVSPISTSCERISILFGSKLRMEIVNDLNTEFVQCILDIRSHKNRYFTISDIFVPRS